MELERKADTGSAGGVASDGRARIRASAISDHVRGVRVRDALLTLDQAIRAARAAGLTVELQLASMVTLGEVRDTPFDPHTAVTITRAA